MHTINVSADDMTENRTEPVAVSRSLSKKRPNPLKVKPKGIAESMGHLEKKAGTVTQRNGNTIADSSSDNSMVFTTFVRLIPYPPCSFS